MDLRWSPTIPLDFIWFQINGYLGWPHDHNVRRARIARYFAVGTIKQHQDHCVQVYVTEPGLPERLAAADDDFNTLIAAGSVVRRSPFRGSPGVIREHWSPEPSLSEQYLALFDEFEGREARKALARCECCGFWLQRVIPGRRARRRRRRYTPRVSTIRPLATPSGNFRTNTFSMR